MAVPPSYDGARIDEGGITLEFVRQMMQEFREGKVLHRRYAFAILLQVKALLQQLPTVIDVPVAPGAHLTVCGDVHGQFFDLCNIFDLNGLPSDESPYLFNGDFVDRGSFSVEVVLTLLALKCLYPAGMHLTRGNHETKAMNSLYGFEGEVRAKYNETMVKLFAETFRCLPLGAVLSNAVFVVHGGLFTRDGALRACAAAVRG
jgi:serine/threonine-protein phosphatase 5